MMREVDARRTRLSAAAAAGRAIFRAPAGIQNPWLASVLIDAHLSLVSWTRRGFDTVSRDGSRIAARLIGGGLRAGDVLLLHDRMPIVLDALPRVLDEMHRRGLRSVALPRRP